MKNTFRQIGREFWAPMLGAVLWVVYEYCNSTTEGERGVSALIKAFGAAFFFISWLLAQWFRIRKQQKVDSYLSVIDTRVSETLSAVQSKTDDLVGHITGGDTICYLDFYERPDSQGVINTMSVRLHGNYPLYDVELYIADIDDYEKRFGSNIGITEYLENRKQFTVGDMSVGIVNTLKCELATKTSRRFNIHFYARNGHFVQQLYLQIDLNGSTRATRILRENIVVYEHVPENFTLVPAGQISWWSPDAPK